MPWKDARDARAASPLLERILLIYKEEQYLLFILHSFRSPFLIITRASHIPHLSVKCTLDSSQCRGCCRQGLEMNCLFVYLFVWCSRLARECFPHIN